MTGLSIISTARALPQNCVSNNDMLRYVDTSDEWIRTRTGIESRYFCDNKKGETTSSLAIDAARTALERSGLSADDIAVCLVATFTPEYSTPSVSCIVQKELGLSEDTFCFDMNAACSGFLYAMETARALLVNTTKKYALIVGAEQVSNVLDFDDRTTCVLFGDGAGAAIVKLSQDTKYEYIVGSRGSIDILNALQHREDNANYLKMDGQEVFRFAVEIITKTVDALMKKAGLAIEDIDMIVCHQANSRIIDSAARKLKLPQKLFYKNMARYGNTSAASIPIALDELFEQGTLTSGKTILCVGFGAGLTWGGIALTI